MKILILTLSLLLTGCSTFSTNNMIVDYENSNPVKVEEATEGLKITKVLPSSNEVNGTIAVRTIELTSLIQHLDTDVIYMIEDNLIANLLENNYRVVERDPQALRDLYKETSTNYKKASGWDDKNSTALIETINLSDLSAGDSSACCGATDVVWDYLVDNHRADWEGKMDDELKATGLDAADYILSYRVLECGVVYNDYDATNTNSESSTSGGLQFGQAADAITKKYERSARTRLHLRLTNSKTSEIIAAGTIENEVTDVVNEDDIESLEKIPHIYYHHTLPLQNTLDASSKGGWGWYQGSEVVNATGVQMEAKGNDAKKDNKPKSSGASKKYLYAAGGLLLFLMMLGGGD